MTDAKTPKQDPERRRREGLEELRAASEPLIQDLKVAGFAVGSVSDVSRLGARASAAVPILIQWLHETPNRDLKSAILRCLGKVPVGADSVRRLIAEFRALDVPGTDGVKWSLGSVIGDKATDAEFDEIVQIATDPKHERAREMVVLALGKMKNPAAVDVLLGLLDDDVVYGQAVSALAKLAPPRVAPQLRRFAKDPKEWIRKEAIAGLARIARGS